MNHTADHNFTIRLAIQADMEQLFDLIKACSRSSDFNRTDFKVRFAKLLSEQKQDRVHILVAGTGEKIVGCAVGYLREFLDGKRIVNLENFFVEKLKLEYKIREDFNRIFATWASSHGTGIDWTATLDEIFSKRRCDRLQ